MRRGFIVSGALLVAAGCAAIAGIEETTTVTDGSDATTADVIAPDAPDPADSSFDDADAGPFLQPDADTPDSDILIPPDLDAALPDEDAGGPDASACALGAKSAYEPTVSGVVTKVCRLSDGLSQGGEFAGLDCYGTGVHTIGPKGVTACMGIDYTTPNLGSATVRLKATDTGCTYGCYAGYCGDEIAAHIYAGTSRDISTWKYVGTAPITRTAANYKFTMPSGNWRVIGICRSGHGSAADDVAVDGISATCR